MLTDRLTGGKMHEQVNFLIIQITNQNEILEADISASDSGLRPSKPSYHLMLGPAPRGDIVLSPT